MSVPVALERLHEEIARYGTSAYLVTVTAESRPHAVSVKVAWAGDDLAVEAGSRTSGNVDANPSVTLLWPATAPLGFTLLVDGDARVDGERALVRPTAAVLHRSRAAAAADSNGPSCVKLLD